MKKPAEFTGVFFNAFGTPGLAWSDGRPVSRSVERPRFIAILAAVAAAGPRGLSRDHLIGLIWPETDETRARHALSQTLYHARGSLGGADIFLPGPTVRLDPAALQADLAAFQAAVAAEDFLTASKLYAGPFLDGFHLNDSVPFEEWLTDQRSRLVSQASEVFEHLATQAAARGAWPECIAWRERQAALDPLSSRHVSALAGALETSGDAPAALRLVDAHKARLRRELEIDPPPDLVVLANRIRSSAPRAVPVAARNDIPALVARDDVKVLTAESPLPRVQAKSLRWRIAAVLALTTTAVAGFVGSTRNTTGVAPTALAPRSILVAPFRTVGAPGLEYLGEGMVDLVSARLADDTVTRAVDPGIALRAFAVRSGMSPTLSAVAQAATRHGASAAIMGSVVRGPAHVHISASLVDAASMQVIARASVDGPPDSLPQIVDRLVATLIATDYGEYERLSLRMTSSLDALKAFLRGQTAYRLGAYSDAATLYLRALSVDSGFALAAFQLALAADRLNDAEQRDDALAVAWANKSDLGERDLAHLFAFAGPRYPRPSFAAEEMAAWERALNVSPDRAEVWYEFGERLLRQGSMLSVTDASRRAVAAFQRSLALDPTDRMRARPMLLLAAMRAADTGEVRRVATRVALQDSMGATAPFIHWRVARLRGLGRGNSDFARLDEQNLRAIVMSSLYDAEAVEDGRHALETWGSLPSSARTLDALLARHAAALNSGNAAAALDVTEQIKGRFSYSGAHLRLRVLDALYGSGDSTAAHDAAGELATRALARTTSPESEAVRLADVCVVEQWRLAAADTQTVRAAIVQLAATKFPRVPVPVGANPHACAMLLDAWFAVATDSRAVRRLFELDSLAWTGPAINDAVRFMPIVTARLFERAGRKGDALRAIRRRSYLSGWPRYLATELAIENRLAIELGDRKSARESARQLAAWQPVVANPASIAPATAGEPPFNRVERNPKR